ncbi:hypothetical protein FSP39_017979 [Pinctada imbricata]|uniref:Glycosyltransferase family 92 protein n=1 Tax=Pinctada imbricata TaxID=66713 RepID=A0AA89BJJ2_PINIB|nr:hypothetical protein FSP39_017979 [Pinctada imbricata]
MIELNRILGADFFIFYNQSSSQNIEGILNHYQAEGLIQIVQWNLPGKVTFYDRIPTQEGGHYYRQVAALNDCVYRNKGVSRYVVNQDLDEFLIPRKLKTWHQLMADIPGGYGSYTFCSAVFPKYWSDALSLSHEDTRDAIEFGSKTVLKQFRYKAFHHDQRTKWIVRPECIVACGIHDIWKTTANASCDNYNVMESKAKIHHYDNWKSIDSTKILDNRINGYKAELLQRLKNKWQILKKFKQKNRTLIE